MTTAGATVVLVGVAVAAAQLRRLPGARRLPRVRGLPAAHRRSRVS